MGALFANQGDVMVLLFNEVKLPAKIDAFVTLHPRLEGSVENSSVMSPPAEIDSTIGIALVLDPYNSRRRLEKTSFYLLLQRQPVTGLSAPEGNVSELVK